jgi:hypothetical protein
MFHLLGERPRSGTGYRRRAFDCGLRVVVAEIISTRSGVAGCPAPSCVCPAWVRTRRGSSPLCEIECIMKYPFNEVVIRSTSRSQLRKGDRPWEGRLGDSHEPMNKNLIRGRQSEVSWHNTAKPSDSALEVNEAVVWRRFVPLPGEPERSGDSLPNFNFYSQSAGKSRSHAVAKVTAPCAAMRWVMIEKSAEVIVLGKESGGWKMPV